MGNAQIFANEFNRIVYMRYNSATSVNLRRRIYHFGDLADSFIKLNEDERQKAVQILGGAENMDELFWRDLMNRGFDITPFRRVQYGFILGAV